jgi:hypothetical protein
MVAASKLHFAVQTCKVVEPELSLCTVMILSLINWRCRPSSTEDLEQGAPILAPDTEGQAAPDQAPVIEEEAQEREADPSALRSLRSSSAEVSRGGAAQTQALTLLWVPQARRWAPRSVPQQAGRGRPEQPRTRWRRTPRKLKRSLAH